MNQQSGSESDRLAALHGCEILDTAPEPSFDNLTRIASQICETPIATVSLVDANRVWFKARLGLDEGETARELGFCDETIRQSEMLELGDAASDTRFARNSLVIGTAAVRFYAGVPLITRECHALGALCVMDRQPRVLSPAQRALLKDLARQAMLQIDHRREVLDLNRAVRQLQEEAVYREEMLVALETEHRLSREIASVASEGIVVYDEQLRYIIWNRYMEQLTGVSEEEVLGRHPLERFPRLRKYGIDGLLDRAGHGEVVTSGDMFIRHPESGRGIWTSARLGPRRDSEGRIIGVIGLVNDVSERKHREAELERSREKLRKLSAHLQAGLEAERARIAREIHDELGARLTGMRMAIGQCLQALTPASGFPVEKLNSVIGELNEAIQTVRSIATRLRPSILDTFGLWEAIEWQAQEFEERTHISCGVTLEANDTTLSDECATAVFRIVQEALTNVARHAKANHVWIWVEQEDENLVIEIRDDGKGMSEAAIGDRNTFGLLSMDERAKIFGGSVVIGSAPGAGTSVVVRLPLEESAG